MVDYLRVVYDEKSHPYTEYPAKLCSYLFHSFAMQPGMRLLEPGCGRCEFLRHFQELGLDCRGVDLSPDAQQHAGSIPIAICDVETSPLPFDDDTFDVVYSKSFLEHLHRPDHFFNEAHRVLRPGGLLLSLVPDWEANYKIYFDDITHRTPFTSVALSDLYQMCDFERAAVYKFRQLPVVWRYPVLNHLCAAISPFIPVRTTTKFLRWSRELQLVGSGRKPAA